jgi:excisionase family DNA binding protein
VAAKPIDVDSLLTPAEVAAILYVDPKTVTRWAKAGKLDCFLTPGGHRRFLKSEIHSMIAGPIPGHGGAIQPLRGYASTLAPESHDQQGIAQQLGGERTTADPGRAAAAVLSEAVVIARQTEAGEVARAVTLTADAVIAAATRSAQAAETARTDRAHAARVAAERVASDAARTAIALQLKANAHAGKLARAASDAAATVAAATPPGRERESALAARRLAATVEADAVAAAEDTAAAAACVADAVAAAAANMAFTVSAAAQAVETEVAELAATIQATATATARQIAATTESRASDAAALARDATIAASRVEDSAVRDTRASVGPTAAATSASAVSAPLPHVLTEYPS